MKYLPTIVMVLAASLPFSASAATFPPYCAVLTKTASGQFWPMINNKLYLIANAGEPITIIWGSANATQAHNGQGSVIGFTGQEVVTPTKTTAYSYTFVGGGTESTCTVTAVVLGSVQGTVTSTIVTPNSISTVTTPVASNTVTSTGAQSTASFSASEIPLLSGGNATPSALVPVQYLKLVNTSNTTTTLPGVWVKQNGTAPVSSIIGFTTVDDKAVYRTSTGMIEGATPFKDGLAYIPLNSTFAPGQFRIFTIKAQMSSNLSAAVGTSMKIDVARLDTSGPVAGSFPIVGTTWTLRAY